MNIESEIIEIEAEFTPTGQVSEFFTSDEVLNAYDKGKQEGMEIGKKVVIEKLVSNINKSGKHIVEIVAFFKENGINPINVFLKHRSVDYFNILFVVTEKDFISDKILPLYNYISDFEDKVSEDLYNVTISIIDGGASFDNECLNSDGYIYKHKLV